MAVSPAELTSPSGGLDTDGLIGLSDQELEQFLEKSRRADGSFHLSVDGWQDLSEEELRSLSRRLLERLQSANRVLKSRPVDLDQVSARLQEQYDDIILSRRSPSPVTERTPPESPPPPEDSLDELMRQEAERHDTLLRDGCCPAYPITFLSRIRHNPEEYVDLMRPWLNHSTLMPTEYWDTVFETQLKRWQDFRNWQIDNRGIADNEKEYLEFVEAEKRIDKLAGCRPGGYNEYIRKRSAIDETSRVQKRWAYRLNDRKRYMLALREDHGRGDFSDYVEEVKRRLARHHFIHPFQLDADPQQQDKLSTWIEYLHYEYAWYEGYTRTFDQVQSKEKAAWESLVDSTCLRPSDTKEFIYEAHVSYPKYVEEQRSAEQTLERAKSHLTRVETASDATREMLESAKAKADKAQESLEKARRRYEWLLDYVNRGRDRRDSRDKKSHQGIRLSWIIAQIPSIEAEMSQSRSTKRKGPPGDDDPEQPSRKRQKPGEEDSTQPSTKRPKTGEKNSTQPSDPSATLPTPEITPQKRVRFADAPDEIIEPPAKKTKTDHQDKGSCEVRTCRLEAPSNSGTCCQ